jgi:UDP-N-acetylglucosamine pyrophosphorylase
MNSFNTESETARVRHKYESRVPFHTFEQSCYPRINQETLRPVPEKPDLHEGELVTIHNRLSNICYFCVISMAVINGY